MNKNLEKKRKTVRLMALEVGDPLILRFFDFDSTKLLDLKIKVLQERLDGKESFQIPEYYDILGVKVPMVTIPVRPGRNLAVILELAAMNNRQKNMGYNAAETLAASHDAAIESGGF